MPEAAGPVCAVGEGPRWDAHRQQWSWVDNAYGRLYLLKNGELTVIEPGVMVVAAIPKTDDGWLLAAWDGLYDFDRRASPRSGPDLAGMRYNDGACDARGRFWVGTMSTRGESGRGVLYRVDDNVTVMAEGFDVCNGLGFSPDNRWLYLVDTMPRVIWRYGFDLGAGALGSRDILFRFPPDMGKPDGLAVDADGGIWCAMWDGARLVRITPGGKLSETITVPVPRPTSLAFGDGHILATTARIGLSEAQAAAFPLSGRALLIPTQVCGVPAYPFGF